MAHAEIEEFEDAESEEVAPAAPSKNIIRVYLNIVLRQWYLLATFAGVGFVAAFYASAQDPSTYLGRFEILVEPVTSAEKRTEAAVLTRSNDLPSEDLLNPDYPTQLKLLKSAMLLSKIAAEIHQTLPQLPEATLLQNLRNNLVVNRVKEGNSRFDYTKIIEVTYEGNDSVLVETVLKVTADQYLQYSLQEREKSLHAGVSFIDKQIPILESQIRSLQEQQRTLQQRYNLLSPNQQATNLNDAYQTNQNNLLKTDEQLEELRALRANLEKNLGLSATEALVALDLSQNPDRQTLLQQLQTLDATIASESSRFTDENPILQDLFEKRKNLQQLLAAKTQEILLANPQKVGNNPNIFMFQNSSRVAMLENLVLTENEISQNLTRRRVLAANQGQLRTNLDQFPSIAASYDEVARQLDLKKGLLDQLANQRETLRVEAAQQNVPWKIISPPAIPLGPNGKPIAFPPDGKKKIIAGMGGGLILGLALAIAIEKIRDRFYSVSDLKFSLGYSVWGPVPLPASAPPKQVIAADLGLAAESVLALVTEPEPESESGQAEEPEQEETYVALPGDSGQEIYTNFYFQYHEQGIRSLAITAIDTDSGQAWVTMAFAQAAVNAGQKVLVIDANLPHPEIHCHCPQIQDGDRGLVTVLNDDTDPLQLLNLIHDEDGLGFIPVGQSPSDPPIRLKRWLNRLDPALQTLTETYDLVIYNAPLLTAPDTPFLLNRVDGLCLVVRLKQTAQSATHQALTTVQKFELPVLGVIATA